jgi:hypothetical protein
MWFSLITLLPDHKKAIAVCVVKQLFNPLDHAPNSNKQSEHGRHHDSECAISRQGWRGHDRSVVRGVRPCVPAAQVSSGK